ncbi:MAG: MHYT domain-containing protein [Hyphomicrobiales bacterium]|nr:MHYT domain-containing protein [Hyphomicrobiales bacterium]
MPFAYDQGLLLLSIGVAMFGAFTAFVMTAGMHRPENASRTLRLMAGGLTLGLSAWAMQFIALLAILAPVRVGYNAALLGGAAALVIAAALGAMVLMTRLNLVGLRLPLGALLLGVGLIGMHYMAMASIAGAFKPKYSALGAALTVVIAVQAALIALYFAFRQRGVLITFVGAALTGAAFAAIPYASMQTAELEARRSLAGFAVPAFSEVSMAWTAAVMVYLFCSVCLTIFALSQFANDAR